MMDERVLREAGIDYGAALARFVGKTSIYERYLGQFLEDAHIADAKDALARGELDGVLDQMHALKGVSGTLGLTALQEACGRVVDDLRSGVTDGLEEKIARAARVQEELRGAIRRAQV